MNSECREFLQNHMEVMMEKNPACTIPEMRAWLLCGEQQFDLSQVKRSTLTMFMKRTMEKFNERGTMVRKSGSGGRNKVSSQVVTRIKRLAMNKKRRGSRRVAAMVGVSKNTVQRYLKKSGAKPYHRRKVQAMKPEHKEMRVKFARWALKQYGVVVNGNTTWGKVVNTDFSAMVKKSGSLNTKNDIIWSKSMEEAGDLLEFTQEKYDESFMVWGGITFKGLVPSNAPVFVCDLKQSWARLGNPVGRGVNSLMYAHLVTTIAVPAVKQLYGERAVWQDDPATIHRSPAALAACSAFKQRIPHEQQAPKMADVWPIENVWAILKQRVMEKEPKTKKDLKNVITNVWKEVDRNKELCRSLISSIPKRLKAVIDNGGSQITKEDYRYMESEEFQLVKIQDFYSRFFTLTWRQAGDRGAN